VHHRATRRCTTRGGTMRPSRLAAAVACVALSGCGAVGGAEPNPASAGWLAPAGTWLSEVSGKMNVPKPSAKFYTGHPLFLWPGLFISPGPHEGYPDRKAMGLFQPVLTLGQGCSSSIGCGPDKPWTIANWYSNCTGSTPDKANYCHDAYQSIQTGDTLSWYMRRVGSSSVFPMQYEMGWSSTLNTSQSAGPFVQTITAGPVFIWAIEAEPWFAINNATIDPSFDMLPQSPYRIWDVVVKDQEGKALNPEWKCGPGAPPAITLDCGWTGPKGESGFSMGFGSESGV
jgi:hypothetical protein